MKTLLISVFALAAAPLSAASLKIDLDALTLSQQAQVFAVMNSEDNDTTRARKIGAIIDGSNATAEDVTAAKIRFLQTEDNTVTRERGIDAARN